MRYAPLLLLLSPAILFGAEFISPVPAGSPPPEGIYYDLGGPYAFPNPFRGGEHSVITFTGLTPQTEISIYDTAGGEVFCAAANGEEYTWNVVNSSGFTLASGVYIYLLLLPEGGTTTGKLALIH